MGAVGFIHQQRHPPGMAECRNGRQVAEHPFIGGAGQDHAGGVGAGVQRGGHGGGRQTAVDPERRVGRRGDPGHRQPAQLDGMVDRFVAVAGADHPAAEGGGGAHGGQDAAGAAPHQIPAAPGPPQRGGAGHGRRQDAPGVVEVVGAGDLGGVPGIAAKPRRRGHPAFVARHVQRVAAAGAAFQRLLQRGTDGQGRLLGGVGRVRLPARSGCRWRQWPPRPGGWSLRAGSGRSGHTLPPKGRSCPPACR